MVRVVIGPLQAGKTTLINIILNGKDFLLLDCDDPAVRTIMTAANTEEIKSVIGGKKLVFILTYLTIRRMNMRF